MKPKEVCGEEDPGQQFDVYLYCYVYAYNYYVEIEKSYITLVLKSCNYFANRKNRVCTGESLSETLIFASTNPQYDDRLFIEL